MLCVRVAHGNEAPRLLMCTTGGGVRCGHCQLDELHRHRSVGEFTHAASGIHQLQEGGPLALWIADYGGRVGDKGIGHRLSVPDPYRWVP